MRGVSPVISIVLTVAIAIAAAVAFYSFSQSMITNTTATAGSGAHVVTTLPLEVESAEITGENNWAVIIRNPNDVDVNGAQLMSYVYSNGVLCATGTAEGTTVIPANGVATVVFTGELSGCSGSELTVEVSYQGLKSSKVVQNNGEYVSLGGSGGSGSGGSEGGSSTAWLSGWSYRRKITIKENSGSDLTDYQVRIELNADNFDFSKANADGNDVRFTDDDGTTELNYWVEDWNAEANKAVIWVKVPLIPANGEVNIYMYYGNSSVGSESNEWAVFIAFEDF